MTDTLKSCPFCNAPLELTPQEGMPEIKWLVHPVTGCMLDEWIMSADEEEMTTWNTRVPPKVQTLKWNVEAIPKKCAGGLWHTARTIVGLYEIHSFTTRTTIYLKTPDYGRMQEFEKIEDARDAAQTDYERRVREALEE